MAAGDVIVFGPTSVAAGSYLDLQPAVGVEVSIHNINHAGAIQLYFYDGVTFALVPSVVVADATPLVTMALRGTNEKYYRVKNITASAILISADGLVTKDVS